MSTTMTEVKPMKKTLYSLMLSEDVVAEVDRLAHRTGTNRSNLVNQILAEYVDMVTPERRIEDIFRQIEKILGTDRELVPYVSPNTQTMSLKSSLQYRYRPTVKYSVELYRDRGRALGELSVIFRTQSAELLTAMGRFFRLWKAVEDELLARAFDEPVQYALYDGRFTRSIELPAGRNYGTADIAGAISEYVRLFDAEMKQYLAGTLSAEGVRDRYARWIGQGSTLI